ncbi:hypothetical protein COCSUDRAFT_64236 [Coccomyxa subellipsoidea C-169]|uniref:Multiple myeloma tumor-associated protein 2-like N-terminal domain-containing protein n=1 Tax=Coccomyxa subellipsoidea (strain C-169) TaxID=574566 RepID=I0Z9X9_COCSC|nr:hypothetical protein COCSUDRAFT_64236 [Coccomyxa subellipsoidea C-169]EIE27448.1 hypothetical protein COCSUDRAFT_64236 [Coccomyxa subellipsoidea C-169]|eukprot:XP_005651992.1 hypothetical protein COCSUDRAFT_64236 [Coccomyxa subellipsoidea C-169]
MPIAGKDVYWYTRAKGEGGDTAAAAELHAVKQREEELMAEALGIKPKVIRAPKQPQLDQKEMAQLMSKDAEEVDGEGGDREAERIKGLGYSVNAVRGAGDAEHEVLAGTLPSKQLPGPPPMNPGQLPPPPVLTEADAKRMRKAQKKAAKEARRAEKKEKRKAKKVLKKAKKAAKRAKVEAEAGPPADASAGGSSPSSSSDGADSDASEPADPAEDTSPAGRRTAPSSELAHVRDRESSRLDGREPARKRRHDSPTPERQHARRRHDSRSRSLERHGGHMRDRREGGEDRSRGRDEGRVRKGRRGGSQERSERRERRRSRSRDRRGRDRT